MYLHAVHASVSENSPAGAPAPWPHNSLPPPPPPQTAPVEIERGVEDSRGEGDKTWWRHGRQLGDRVRQFLLSFHLLLSPSSYIHGIYFVAFQARTIIRLWYNTLDMSTWKQTRDRARARCSWRWLGTYQNQHGEPASSLLGDRRPPVGGGGTAHALVLYCGAPSCPKEATNATRLFHVLIMPPGHACP